MDRNLDINCTGCSIPLTIDNAGGYRCFCTKCVEAIGPPPNDGKGYLVIGQYPNLKWTSE